MKTLLVLKTLLMLKVLFALDSEVGDPLCGVHSGSESSLFFINSLFSLWFEPVHDDFQHDFTGMADETDGSAVLTELQLALFRECNNQRLSPWGSASLLFSRARLFKASLA